jgi:hypothetical protein
MQFRRENIYIKKKKKFGFNRGLLVFNQNVVIDFLFSCLLGVGICIGCVCVYVFWSCNRIRNVTRWRWTKNFSLKQTYMHPVC